MNVRFLSNLLLCFVLTPKCECVCQIASITVAHYDFCNKRSAHLLDRLFRQVHHHVAVQQLFVRSGSSTGQTSCASSNRFYTCTHHKRLPIKVCILVVAEFHPQISALHTYNGLLHQCIQVSGEKPATDRHIFLHKLLCTFIRLKQKKGMQNNICMMYFSLVLEFVTSFSQQNLSFSLPPLSVRSKWIPIE